MVSDALHPFQADEITIDETLIEPRLRLVGDAVRVPQTTGHQGRAKNIYLLALCPRRGGADGKDPAEKQTFEDF